jgi:F0F1-type ATP synthase membrane subunit c/vacuolar-type H+-ATPase subunit K
MMVRKRGGREMIKEEELSKGLLTLRVIWLGMLGSLAIYLFIGLQIATNLKASTDESTYAVLKPVLYIFTFVVLIITGYMKKHMLSPKGQHRQATQSFQHPTIRSFQHPALQNYANAMILAWALSESIGIFGLALFLLGKNPMDLYLLILISAAAMLMYRPRKDEVINLAQRS